MNESKKKHRIITTEGRQRKCTEKKQQNFISSPNQAKFRTGASHQGHVTQGLMGNEVQKSDTEGTTHLNPFMKGSVSVCVGYAVKFLRSSSPQTK